MTRFKFHAPRSSLTLRMSTWSLVVPGKLHNRTGIPSRVTAMPITIWGRSGLWSFEWPEYARVARSATVPGRSFVFSVPSFSSSSSSVSSSGSPSHSQ